jgi:hypothetical protein
MTAQFPDGPRFLVGPLSARRPRMWEAHRQAGNALVFGPGGDLDVKPGDDWDALAARLPAGWRPDALVLHLDYLDVPPVLWDSPLPTVALAPDWQLQWHAFRRLLPFCELILTDTAGVDTLARQGIPHARAANLFGTDPAWLEDELAEGARDIDILFVGNLHPAVQAERGPWLDRLAALARRCRSLLHRGRLAEARQGPKQVRDSRWQRRWTAATCSRSWRGRCSPCSSASEPCRPRSQGPLRCPSPSRPQHDSRLRLQGAAHVYDRLRGARHHLRL